MFVTAAFDVQNILDISFYNSTSSIEEPACCNVSRISFFFSPESERASETVLSYILVGQPHPEGCSEDERGGE